MRQVRKLSFLLFLLMLVVVISPLIISQAQDASATTITMAVPEWMKDVLDKDMIARFETENPGIRLKVVGTQSAIPSPANGLDAHLEAVEKYASAADVVFVDIQNISPEATRAGYFLDLMPMTTDDKALNSEDFYPSVWQAFQWDKGLWALPTGVNVMVLTYDPAAFDTAGVAYPNEKWTLDDFVDAARKLAGKDAEGKITSAGVDVFNPIAQFGLLVSASGIKTYDESTLPDKPVFTDPALVKAIETFAELEEEGVIGNGFNEAPMGISPVFAIAFGPRRGNTEQQRVGTLLPGGKSLLDVQGFAISSGSQHPEQAYALLRFLSQRPELGGRFASVSARKSLIDAQSDGPGPRFNPGLTPEIKALTEQALQNGLTLSEGRYATYLMKAVDKMKSDQLDAASALQAVELEASQAQQMAADKKTSVAVVVATAVPDVEVKAGESIISFGMTSFVRPMPNQDKWDSLARQFAESDPQIGRIDIEVGFGNLNELMDTHDCVYLPFNGVPSAQLDKLLNLDPFLATDTSFDKNDVVGNLMAQLTRDNKVWGYPINLQPAGLRYNVEQFTNAGLEVPTNGWTIDQFNDVLQTLKANSTEPPFVPMAGGGTHLLMLIAAYGGLPFDYRTTPPTINFTDPATVAAIRQVLDLAKNGYMKYEEVGGNGRIVRFVNSEGSEPALTTDAPGGFRLLRIEGNDPYRSIPYPKGTAFNPVSYGVGVGYISAKAKNPDGCYRWLSTIAQHPELFSVMPARRSLINDPTISAAQGQDATATYNVYDALLKEPNTIVFPTMFEGGVSPTGFISQSWLYQAFDEYVLHDGDLEAALKEAQNYATSYQECTANIPPYDPASGQSQREYNRAYLECAAKVDSRLSDFVESIR